MKYPEETFLKVISAFQAENMDEITVFVDDIVAALDDPQSEQHDGWLLVVNRSLGPNNGQRGLIPDSCVILEDQAIASQPDEALQLTNNNMELSQIIEEDSHPNSQTALEAPQEIKEEEESNITQTDSQKTASITAEDTQIVVKEVPVGTNVISRYEYFAEKSDELELQIDDVIVVLECPPGGWWRGMINQGKIVKTGWFPATLVEVLPEPSSEQESSETYDQRQEQSPSEGHANAEDSKQGPRKIQWFQKLTGTGKRGRSQSVDAPTSQTPSNSNQSSSTLIRSSSDVTSAKVSSPSVSPSVASSRLSFFEKAKPGVSMTTVNSTLSASSDAASIRSMPASRVSFMDKHRQSTASVYSNSSANSSALSLPSPTLVIGPASTETWKDYVDESVINSLSKLEKKRQDVIWELMLTERSYISDLELIQQVFARPLNEQKILSAKHSDLIFGNLDEISAVNFEFLQVIEDRWENSENHIVEQVGDLFIQVSSKLICYLSYCVEREHALSKIQTLLKANKQFKQFLKDSYQSGVTKNLDIGSYLIKPPQRICKYPLLIKELLKATATEHPDRKSLEKAYYHVHMIITVINLGKDYQESTKKLVDIQNSFTEEKLDIAIPQRYLIREDSIYYTQLGQNVKDAKQPRRIYLFNDSLLIARKDWREKLHLTLWTEITSLSVSSDIHESFDEETSLCLTCSGDILQKLDQPVTMILTMSAKNVKASWLESLKKMSEVFDTIQSFKPDASKADKALAPRELELVSDAVKESVESLSNMISDDRADSPSEGGESDTRASLNSPDNIALPEQSSRPVSMIEGWNQFDKPAESGKSRSSNDLLKVKPVINKNLNLLDKSIDSSNMSVFQSKLLEKDNVITQQANTISKLNLKLNDIERRYKDLYEIHTKQETKISEAAIVNKNYAQVKTELEELEKTRRRESERFSSQLDSLKRDHENLIKMLDEEKQNSNRRIEREIASATTAHEEDIKRAKTESEFTVKSLKTMIKDLTSSNQRKSDEITRLEREKNSMLFAFNKSTGDENQDFKIWQETADEYETTIKNLHAYLEESEKSSREQLARYQETELNLRKNLDQVILESRRKEIEKNSVIREMEILVQRRELEVQSTRSLLSDSQESQKFAWESVESAKKDVFAKNEVIKERDVQIIEKEKFIADQKIELNTRLESIKSLEFEIERLRDFEQNHSKLNNNVHELHSSLRKAEKEAKKLAETKAELEQKISDSEREINRLKKIEIESNDLKNHIDSKSKEIGRLSQINLEFDQFRVKSQLDQEKTRMELQTIEAKHMQDLEVQKVESLKLYDTISSKDKEIESGLQMLKMTKDIVGDLEKLRDANEKEIGDLKNKMKVAVALKRKLKKTEEEKLAILEESRALKTVIEQRDSEIQGLENEIHVINSQKEEISTNKQSILAERESMRMVIVDMEHIISSSDDPIDDSAEITEYLMRVVKKLHDFKLQKDSLQDELELLRNQHQELEDIHQQQEEDMTEVVNTLKSLESKAVQQRDQYEKMINVHINDNAKLVQQIQELINSPKTNEEAMQRWLAKFEKVQNEYVACQKELISLKADNAEIKEKLHFEDGRLHTSYAAAKMLKREIRLLQETIFRMQDEEKKLSPEVVGELKRLKDQNYYLKQALHETKLDMMSLSLNASNDGGEAANLEKTRPARSHEKHVVDQLEYALAPLMTGFERSRKVNSGAAGAESDDFRTAVTHCVNYLRQLALLNKNFLSSVCSVLVLSDCDSSAAMSLFSIEASAKIDDIAERHSDLFSRQLHALQSKLEDLISTINGELSAKDSELSDMHVELDEARREVQKTRETIQELRKYNESLHEQMKQVKETLNLRTMLEQAIAETQTPDYEQSAEREPTHPTLDLGTVSAEDLINDKENIENEFQILLQLFGAIYDGDMKHEENLRTAFESAKYLNEINKDSSSTGSISFYMKILLDRMSKFRMFLENLLRAYAKHGISLGSNIQRNTELKHLKVESEELKYANRQLSDKLSIREKELSLYVQQLKRKETELQTIIKERTNISQMVVEACTELEHLVSTTN